MTAPGGEKLELELLPKELYGNVPKPLHSLSAEDEELDESRQGGIFEQLYHRNVFHMAVLYILLCWVVVQVVPPLFRELTIPSWVSNAGAGAAVLGLPLIMLFSWSMQLTASGWRPVGRIRAGESQSAYVRRQLNRAIIVVFAVAIGFVFVGKALLPARDTRVVVAAGAPSVPAPAAPSSAPVAAGPASIAVLAISESGEGKDLSYLANGLSEGLPSALSSLPQLLVISGDSSLRFRGGTTAPVTLGAALGARYLVDGSMAQVNDRLEVTVHVVDTRDGSRRPAGIVERDVGDSFRLRDDVAAEVAKALGLPIAADALQSRRGVRNASAYELYLRARLAFRRGDRAGYQQAEEFYNQALEIEPQSAAIEAGIAELNLAMVGRGYKDQHAGIERARNAAERAAALDAGLAEPLVLLATIHSAYDWNWADAKRDLDKAYALAPREAGVLAGRGDLNLAAGNFAGAARDLQSAFTLNPLDFDILLDLARAQLWAGQLAPAEASLRSLLQLDPNRPTAHYALGKVLLAGGDREGALAEMKREGDARHRFAGMAEVFGAMGREPESDTALNQLKALAGAHGATSVAGVYASRGETEAALQWLDRAYGQKDADLPVVRGDPSFRSLADLPRFGEFLRRLNLPG